MPIEPRSQGVSRFGHLEIVWHIHYATATIGPRIDGNLHLYRYAPRQAYLLTVASRRHQFRLVAENGWQAEGELEMRTPAGERWPILWGHFAFGFQGHQEIFEGDVAGRCDVVLVPGRPVVGQTTRMADIEPVELFRLTSLLPPPPPPLEPGWRRRFLTFEHAAGSQLVQALAVARERSAEAMAKRAAEYLAGGDFVSSLAQLATPLDPLQSFVTAVAGWSPSDGRAGLDVLVQDAGVSLDALRGDAYEAQRDRLWNSLLAVVVAGDAAFPAAGQTRGALVASLRSGLAATNLLAGLADDAPELSSDQGIAEALTASVALPGSLLPLPAAAGQPAVALDGAAPPAGQDGWIRVLGIGELEIVRQRLLGYALGEVARIDNVMRGELRRRRRARSERQAEDRAGRTDRDLAQRDDLAALQREIAAVGASHTETYTSDSQTPLTITRTYSNTEEDETLGGAFTITRTTTPGDDALDPGRRAAARFARELTAESASRLRERVERGRAQSELDLRELDNRHGRRHVVGVYRWVRQILRAHVERRGRRVIIELYLPDPAAPLRAGGGIAPLPASLVPPPALDPPIRSASDITADNYAALAARYGASAVQPPPAPRIVSALARAPGEPATQLIPLPEGMSATTATVTAYFTGSAVTGLIGKALVQIPPPAPGAQPPAAAGGEAPTWQSGAAAGIALAGETGGIVASLSAGSRQQLEASIEITCQPTADRTAAWQLDVFNRVVAAWEDNLRRYGDARADAYPSGEVDLVRATLRRGCELMLLARASGVAPGDLLDAPGAPTPAQVDLLYAIDQAFAWRDLTWTFWPPSLWPDASGQAGGVAQRFGAGERGALAALLAARAAIVNVAVKPELLGAVLELLALSGRLPPAPPPAPAPAPPPFPSPVPIVTDSLIPLLEELERLRRAPPPRRPRAPPWRVEVPTGMVALEGACELPWFCDFDDCADVVVYDEGDEHAPGWVHPDRDGGGVRGGDRAGELE